MCRIQLILQIDILLFVHFYGGLKRACTTRFLGRFSYPVVLSLRFISS